MTAHMNEAPRRFPFSHNLRTTVKWELRKWWRHIMIASVPLMWLPLFLFIPIPQEHWADTLPMDILRGFMLYAIIASGLMMLLSGLYMMLVYPFSMVFTHRNSSTLLERGSGRSYGYQMCTRLVLNILTFCIGIGILWLTMRIGQRFTAIDIQWLQNFLASDELYVFWEIFLLFTIILPLILRGCMIIFDSAQNTTTLTGWEIYALTPCFVFLPMFVPVVNTAPQFLQRLLEPLPAFVPHALFAVLFVLTAACIVRLHDRHGEVNV